MPEVSAAALAKEADKRVKTVGKKEDTFIRLRLKTELYEKLQAYAKKTDQSTTRLINQILAREFRQ